MRAPWQDATHWDRGTGDCRLSFTAPGQRLFGALAGEVRARFANGPILRVVEAADGHEAVAVQALAHFASEFRAPAGAAFFMAGSPAIVGGAAGSKSSSWQPLTPPLSPAPRRPRASTVRTAHLRTTGGCCGRGLVTLFSPHLEDGADEAAKVPFRNAIRLCSSFCQHVRSSGAGPEQVKQLFESICTGRDPPAEGEQAATPSGSASPSPLAPPSAPPAPPPPE